MSGRKYTKEELVKELDRVSKEHCNRETPRVKDMRRYGNYSEQPYKRVFGSWNQAVENAGFQRNIQFDISEKCLCRSCHHEFEGKWQDMESDEFVEKAKNAIK